MSLRLAKLILASRAAVAAHAFVLRRQTIICRNVTTASVFFGMTRVGETRLVTKFPAVDILRHDSLLAEAVALVLLSTAVELAERQIENIAASACMFDGPAAIRNTLVNSFPVANAHMIIRSLARVVTTKGTETFVASAETVRMLLQVILVRELALETFFLP